MLYLIEIAKQYRAGMCSRFEFRAAVANYINEMFDESDTERLVDLLVAEDRVS